MLQEKVSSFDQKYMALLHALSELSESKSFVKKIDDFIKICEKIWEQDYFGLLTCPIAYLPHTYHGNLYAAERSYEQDCKILGEYRAAVTTQNFDVQIALLLDKKAKNI